MSFWKGFSFIWEFLWDALCATIEFLTNSTLWILVGNIVGIITVFITIILIVIVIIEFNGNWRHMIWKWMKRRWKKTEPEEEETDEYIRRMRG